jgi:YidC/Oxa1 family membrane protein insertase
MHFWGIFVNVMSWVLLSSAHVVGSIALGIFLVALISRIILLPLTVRFAHNNLVRQILINKLQPAIEKLKKTYKDQPQELAKRTLDMYKRNGISLFDMKGFLGMLVQVPVFFAMYSAIRHIDATGGAFLWMTSIARPDLILTLIAAGLTYAASALTPGLKGQPGQELIKWMPAVLTLIFLTKLSAAIGIYWVASSLVSVIQSMILRHRSRDMDPALIQGQNNVSRTITNLKPKLQLK